MRRGLLIALSLLLGAHCAARPNRREAAAPASPEQLARPAGAGASPTPVLTPESVGREAVPEEFKGLDFANFIYPGLDGKKGVLLGDGSVEQPDPLSGGETFELVDVSYADLTGDGKKEAIVDLFVLACGGSCDGGSHEFYVYKSGGRRPRLFWRVSTGSLAYGCGLKSLTIRGRQITLEVFKDCVYDGGAFGSGDKSINKFEAKEFTRFDFESDGRRVSLRRREVFPFPEGNVMNYVPEMSISDE